MIPVFLGISIISFFVMYAAGDPLQIIRMGRPTITQETIDYLKAYYGLDKPVPIQYLSWLSNLLRLDFGKSLFGGELTETVVWRWLGTARDRLLQSLVALHPPPEIEDRFRGHSRTSL